MEQGHPRFEVDPSARLVEVLRQVLPGFQPTFHWWFQVERRLKDISKWNHPEEHDAFVRNYFSMTSEDVIKFIMQEGLVPAPPVNEYHRIVTNLGTHERKVLALMDQWNATAEADCITRSTVAMYARMTEDQVKTALRNLRVMQPRLYASKRGQGNGIWLTAEGVLVARLISKGILPKHDATQLRCIRGVRYT